MILRAFVFITLLVLPFVAHAVQPDEVLDDPKLEERARDISVNIRCLVCRNQSIDDSDADLAKDLRVIIRERLTKGDTNQQVEDYLVARYGEFVLLKPKMGLIWLLPFMLIAIGVIMVIIFVRKQKVEHLTKEELSDDEEKAVNEIMSKDL